MEENNATEAMKATAALGATDVSTVTEESLKTSTRPRFRKQLGVTLAAGIGALTFAAKAFATSGNCCASDTCGGCGDPRDGNKWCYCDCPGGTDYCWFNPATACIHGCVSCPC